jgi:hypothetical protein
MENLTTDEAGSRGSGVEAAPALQDVDDLLRMSVSGAGTSASVCVGASVDACDKISPMSAAAGEMSCNAAAAAPGGDVLCVGRELV